jgi:hypothetical protein
MASTATSPAGRPTTNFAATIRRSARRRRRLPGSGPGCGRVMAASMR